MTIRGGIGFQTLLDEANSRVKAISPAELADQIENDDIALIDLRDIRELEREGQLKGGLHAPRGMLEFWIDPDSPYARPIFQEEKKFIFYCRSGWRSALATDVAMRLGLQQTSHLAGGFTAWKEAGFEITAYAPRKKSS